MMPPWMLRIALFPQAQPNAQTTPHQRKMAPHQRKLIGRGYIFALFLSIWTSKGQSLPPLAGDGRPPFAADVLSARESISVGRRRATPATGSGAAAAIAVPIAVSLVGGAHEPIDSPHSTKGFR